MRFTPDGAPAYFSIAMLNHLYSTYLGKWIGRGKPTAWPQRSSDLNPLVFFFWEDIKSLMCEGSAVEDLTVWIIVASANIANTPESFDRVQQSFGVSCSMTYVVANSSHSCDNHLSLHF
ncbi:uncharacterized protein TNCV_1567041 [Trichonephila clavipes]|nr:uncharacterized protein TNCV_1567041 [Trichonephila clavipes]